MSIKISASIRVAPAFILLFKSTLTQPFFVHVWTRHIFVSKTTFAGSTNMFTQWRWSYRKVDTDSLEDGECEKPAEEAQEQSRSTRLVTTSTVIFLVAIVTIPIFILLGIYQLNASNDDVAGYYDDQSSSSPCGNSSTEALARGCSFDQLMWAWFPKHCPHYANDEFLTAEPEQPWRFYPDPHNREPVVGGDWVKVLDNEIMVYGERREHLTHCVYMFLTLGQIFRDEGRYTPKHIQYEHIHHCTNILLEALRKDDNWYGIETYAGPVSYDQTC
jgi:hypothetical protein